MTVVPGAAGDRLSLRLTFAVTNVARPIPTVRLRPAPDAAEVEIDSPQWTSVSVTADVDLPAKGGRALVGLPGLSGDPSLALVAVVHATPGA